MTVEDDDLTPAPLHDASQQHTQPIHPRRIPRIVHHPETTPSSLHRSVFLAVSLAVFLLVGAALTPHLPLGWGSGSAPSVSAASAPAISIQDAMIDVAGNVGSAVVSIRTPLGLGSGVLYDTSGLVLTNAHVVEGAQSVTAVLADGRHVTGTVLGSDPGFDLAVVHIDAAGATVAPLGSSEGLVPGQLVVAIGNPYGFDRTVTTGVVSALNRPITESQKAYAQGMIQTDAAINPGNSGGPLVDLDGHVVGITTLVAAPAGYPAQGLGFAIPIDTAKRIAPQLAQDGHVSHSGQPFLGVAVSAITPSGVRQQSAQLQPSVPGADNGVVISRVDPNGAATAAGLQVGDEIRELNGKEIFNRSDFLQYLLLLHPGDRIGISVDRAGTGINASVVLGEAPAQ